MCNNYSQSISLKKGLYLFIVDIYKNKGTLSVSGKRKNTNWEHYSLLICDIMYRMNVTDGKIHSPDQVVSALTCSNGQKRSEMIIYSLQDFTFPILPIHFPNFYCIR